MMNGLTAVTSSCVPEQIRKWGIMFDGCTNPLPFLESIEERAMLYEIDLDRLPRSMCEVLVGQAALWFRVSRLRDVTWKAFKAEFLEYFLLPQYVERQEDKISARKQREDENFKDYALDILEMMHYAGYSLEQELQMVYKNLAPAYQLYIRRKDFSSLGQLAQLAYEFEYIRNRCRVTTTYDQIGAISRD